MKVNKILRLLFNTDAEILLSNGRHVVVHVSRLKPAPPGKGRGISDKNLVANDNTSLLQEPHHSQTEDNKEQRNEYSNQPTDTTATTQPEQPSSDLNESEQNSATNVQPDQPENSTARHDRPRKDLSKVKGKSDTPVR